MAEVAYTSIEDYLRKLVEFRVTANFRAHDEGWRFGSVEELVLHYGRPFTPAPRPEWMGQGEMKQCYPNSMNFAMERDDVTYVEGFGNSGFFPMSHGWLTQDGVTAIDPTWPDGVEYFGIPFAPAFWRAYIVKAGYWGVLFPEFPHEHLVDLLKHGLPEGAIQGDHHHANADT